MLMHLWQNGSREIIHVINPSVFTFSIPRNMLKDIEIFTSQQACLLKRELIVTELLVKQHNYTSATRKWYLECTWVRLSGWSWRNCVAMGCSFRGMVPRSCQQEADSIRNMCLKLKGENLEHARLHCRYASRVKIYFCVSVLYNGYIKNKKSWLLYLASSLLFR